jgi:uncharacterized protein with ParB-like and HNH nuclease domain
MEYQHWTIKEAMKQIGAKKLYLPAIQRKFVWDANQIERLFDSIMRDYPIGTFLFTEFFEERRSLLKEKLAKLLDVSLKEAF